MVSKQHGLIGWLGVKRRSAQTPALGERELAIMEILWCENNLSAQQILERFGELNISLQTIQSTIERLYRKELLTRKKSGRAYFYRTTISKTEFIGSLLKDITSEVAQGDMASMISGFVKFLTSETSRNNEPLDNLIKTIDGELAESNNPLSDD